MKTTGLYYTGFYTVGASEMREITEYDNQVTLINYKFKKHLWFSLVSEINWLGDEGFYYMTVDSKLLFSGIVENGKATVYIMRDGKRYEYRTFKVR